MRNKQLTIRISDNDLKRLDEIVRCQQSLLVNPARPVSRADVLINLIRVRYTEVLLIS